MTKIAYNACYGGFGLSEEAIERYAELTGTDTANWCRSDFVRHDPALIQVIEELGEAADGFFAKLRVEEIEGKKYRIDEYDGFESVEQPNDIEWIELP